jgi:hypothetical protein
VSPLGAFAPWKKKRLTTMKKCSTYKLASGNSILNASLGFRSVVGEDLFFPMTRHIAEERTAPAFGTWIEDVNCMACNVLGIFHQCH